MEPVTDYRAVDRLSSQRQITEPVKDYRAGDRLPSWRHIIEPAMDYQAGDRLQGRGQNTTPVTDCRFATEDKAGDSLRSR